MACGSWTSAAGSVGEFGYPAADVAPVGVEPLALAARVEDPEVRSGVGAGTGRPLPAVVVRGQITVVEVVEEVAGATSPVEVEILHEEAGDDHPHPVVDEPLGDELTHSGVDDREAGAARAPGSEPFVGELAGVHRDARRERD